MIEAKVFTGDHPKFEDLEFTPVPLMEGVQARIKFPNGWGASVVKHRGSYGGLEGLYELAVLDDEGNLSYDTPITSDVEGWLPPFKVSYLLQKIHALSPGDEGKRKLNMIVDGETITLTAGKG